MNITNILIIGSHGQMGHLFARCAHKAGKAVRGLDRPLTPEAIAEAAKDTHMVLLAVPAAALREVSRMCAAAMNSDQILADICSVKVRPLADMMEFHDGPVVGTHPLFGPEPAPGETRVAITPGRDDEAAAAVTQFMDDLGFEPFETTAAEHDEAMACIQGLNFVTSVAYLATLAHRPELKKYVTPSFTRRLDAARKMLTEDSALFAGIMEANPFTQESVRKYRSMLNIAAGGDIELLCERANWWWWREDKDRGGS